MQDVNLVIIGRSPRHSVLRMKPSGPPKTEFTVECGAPQSPTSEKRMTDMFLVDIWTTWRSGASATCARAPGRGHRLASARNLSRTVMENVSTSPSSRRSSFASSTIPSMPNFRPWKGFGRTAGPQT